MSVASDRAYFEPAIETLAPARRKEWQEERLRALIAHAYSNAPAVRAKLDDAGVRPESVRSVDDLQVIPITRKDHLIELQKQQPPFGGFLAVPMSEVKRIFTSPGPLYEPEGKQVDSWRWAKPLWAAGFRPGDIVINTYAYHLTPAGRMFEAGLDALGAVSVPGGVGNAEIQLRVMRDLGITGYIGTPTFLMAILDRGPELEVDPKRDLRLRVASLSGEMVPDSLRRAIEDRCGAISTQVYGTADCGALGYECSERNGMHVPEEVLLEIVDPATGKQVEAGTAGEVVVTVCNDVYPLVRFGTGDLSALKVEPCPCGRTSPRLVRIMGRVGDAVKVRGMFVHPRESDEAMSRFPEVARYRIVVTRSGHRDNMRAEVELQPGSESADLLARVADRLRDALKLRAEVEIIPAGTIREGEKRIIDERQWD